MELYGTSFITIITQFVLDHYYAGLPLIQGLKIKNIECLGYWWLPSEPDKKKSPAYGRGFKPNFSVKLINLMLRSAECGLKR